MNEDTSDVLDWLMYHECLSTSLLSLRIATRIMQDKCRLQILYSCLWTFFVERLWYTCPYYFCFLKSSGLLLLLLEPTLSLVRVLLLDTRLSLVRVAAPDLVLNPDSDIRPGRIPRGFPGFPVSPPSPGCCASPTGHHQVRLPPPTPPPLSPTF